MTGAVLFAPASAPAPLPCVVDARLALGPHGLRCVAALARQGEAWLPRELHGILCEPRAYLREPERLLPRVYGRDAREIDREVDAAAAREQLEEWRRFAADAELAALPLFHLGDRADECRAPEGVERGLRERCEQLQRGLDLLVRGSGYDLPRGTEVAACFRDAAALAAALASQGGLIATRLEADGRGAPAVCDYLDAWGARVRQAPRLVRAARSLLGAAGLAPLRWAGVRIAAVHVVCPGPVVGGPDARLDDAAVAARWRRAEVYWHEV